MLHAVYSSAEILAKCPETRNSPIIVEEYSKMKPMVLETYLATFFFAFTKTLHALFVNLNRCDISSLNCTHCSTILVV